MRIIRKESTHDEVEISRPFYMVLHICGCYYGREVTRMSDYELLMIMLTILALLFTACGFLMALLSFLDKREKKQKK